MNHQRNIYLKESNNIPTAMNRLHCCIKYILPLTIACGNISGSNVLASEYFFDPSLLETSKSGQTPVDLSLFSHENAQQPGTYSVDVFINNIKIKQQTIVFVTSNNKQLQPQFTVGQLRELGFKIDEYSFFTDTENSTQVDDLAKAIPGCVAVFDFNHSKLKLAVPQIALYRDARDYVDPSRWDSGVPVVFSNYNFTGSESHYGNGERSQRQYMNLQNGANVGPWRVRNYSTWSHNDD